MGTFLAILLGTIAGGMGGGQLLAVAGLSAHELLGIAVIGIAVPGYLSALMIPRAAATDPDLTINWNIFTKTGRLIGFARQRRSVFLSILGISWFWLLGGIYLTQLSGYCRDTLGGGAEVMTFFPRAG